MNPLPDTLQPAPGGDLLAELLERPIGYTGGDDPPDEEIVYVLRWTEDDDPEENEEDEPAPPPPKAGTGWFWLGALLGLTI